MTDTIARLRSGKMIFETMVDLDNAMKFKKGEKVGINDVIRDTAIYTDLKKGFHAGNAELKNVFKTTEFPKIVGQIVRKGELEVTQEFRDEAMEDKRKQIIDFLVRNAVDSNGRPFTPAMLESSMKEAGIKIDNQPIDRQISGIVENLKKVIPIKIETKKIKIKIPAMHTGKVYGLVNEYKEGEKWLGNGDLVVILNIPVGLQMDFYDKLNAVTHGAALTEEVKEDK